MTGEPFRWHVLSECPDEDACPIHGLNEVRPGYVPLEYERRTFLVPERFSEDVKRANQLAAYLSAIDYASEERQREVNPATHPDWYEGYDRTRREYLRLCAWLIPHALPIPAAPREDP